MKEAYEKPTAVIDDFKTVDVITTSGDDNDVEWGS